MFRKMLSLMILTASLFILNASAMKVYAQRSNELPPLTELGPYSVGLKVFDFTDGQREDWHLETGNACGNAGKFLR